MSGIYCTRCGGLVSGFPETTAVRYCNCHKNDPINFTNELAIWKSRAERAEEKYKETVSILRELFIEWLSFDGDWSDPEEDYHTKSVTDLYNALSLRYPHAVNTEGKEVKE